MKFSEGQNAARELLGGPQRYSCIVGGARAGKTFILARAIFHRALKGAGSRHAILRFHANAARAAIARDTLPKIARLCFPGLKLKEYRQDGFFEFPNGSQVWIGGLDDIHASDPNVAVRLVVASRGKAVRAEPVSTRYAQGQVRHAGRFAKLEEQLCAFSSRGYMGADSPDRADACVWALTYLLGISDGLGLIEFYRRAVEGQASGEQERLSASRAATRLVAPIGVSAAYGRSGARYVADAAGMICVEDEIDVEPLRAAGFTDI